MNVSASSMGVNSAPDTTIGVVQVISLVRRNIVTIIICALFAAVCAYAFAKSHPARYTASASIAIEAQSFAIPELEGAVRSATLPDPMPVVRTEMQALTSVQLVQQVIAKMGLDRLAEFNPALRAPTVFESMKQRLQRVLPLSSSSSATFDAAQAVQSEVLRALVVTQDNRSLVIGVAFTSKDPRLAATFVNDLIDAYLEAQSARRTSANRAANAELLQRIDDTRNGLASLEQKMRDLRDKNELVGLRAGSIGQQQLEEFATAAARAGLDRADLEAKYERARSLASGGFSGDVDNVLASPTITRLREQEGAAAQNLAELQSHYGPDYPGVRSAQADLQAASSQVAREAQRIVSSLGAQLAVARAREADTQRQLQIARDTGVKAENSQAELNDVQQEVNAQRTLYQNLLQGAQRTTAQSTPTQSLDARVLSRAVPPVTPSSPNTKAAAGMGGAGGFVVGILVSLLQARRADLLVTAGEVSGATGLTVAAIIPKRSRRQSLTSRMHSARTGREAEALRLLRGRLRASGLAGAPRSILFVSLEDDLEAASLATAFAYVAAGDGEKVILVEGNLGAPRVAGLLGIGQASLLPVLHGEAAWRDVLLKDPSVQLDILATPQGAPGSNALLGGSHFQNLLSDLHGAYNLIVLAGPPAASADTLALAAEANATVLVIHAERTAAKAAREVGFHLSAISKSGLAAAFVAAR